MSILKNLMTAHSNVDAAQTALKDAEDVLAIAQAAYDAIQPQLTLIEQLDSGASLEIHALLDQIKNLL